MNSCCMNSCDNIGRMRCATGRQVRRPLDPMRSHGAIPRGAAHAGPNAATGQAADSASMVSVAPGGV